MKAHTKASICLVAVALAMLLCGCELRSANTSVRITPDSVTIRQGQSIEFTASGGYEYEWSLSDNQWGYLSTRRGPRTVYTSANSHTNSFTQILTVVSTIPDNVESNAYQKTAEAYIWHEPAATNVTAKTL